MTSELQRMDATEVASRIRTGECSAREAVDSAIDAIERVNPELNAVIHPLFDRARTTADAPLAGPFAGVPMCIKDAVAHTAGDPYHVGMQFLKDLEWREDTDSELVRRFRAAGFIVVGKTNTPELASAVTTEPEAYGPSRNPWDTQRSTGGSSGGSAAAVAAEMVAVAHGNDMGGSIRSPASSCGLVGLKPTRGRTSLAPAFGEYWGPTTHEGVLTRSVRDTAAVLDAISGPSPGDPYTAPAPRRPFALEVTPEAEPIRLRIGLRTEVPVSRARPHSECEAAVQQVGDTLEALGHDVSWSGPEALDESLDEALLIFPVFIARELERWSARTGRPIRQGDVEDRNWTMAELGRSVTATQYLGFLERIQAWSRRLAAWWSDGFDVLVTPTLPEPPPPLGDSDLTSMLRMLPFLRPYNLSGQPAISLPLCRSAAGLPIGVQFVAPQGGEDVLLRLAAQLERAMPWRDHRPAVHA